MVGTSLPGWRIMERHGEGFGVKTDSSLLYAAGLYITYIEDAPIL